MKRIPTCVWRATYALCLTVLLFITPTAHSASYCLEFGKNCDSYVTIPYSPDFNFQGPFTIECWFTVAGPMRNDHPALISTFGASDESGIGWQIGLFAPEEDYYPTKVVGAHFDDFPALYAPFKPVENRWYHVAFTYNGSMVRLFLNGELLQELDTVIKSHPKDNVLTIGGQCGTIGNRNLFGRMDEVRISTICRYTEDFIPRDFFNLNNHTVALWHFDEGSGDTVYDIGPHSHHGTIHNARWVKLSTEKGRPFRHIQTSLFQQKNLLLAAPLILLVLTGLLIVIYKKRYSIGVNSLQSVDHLDQTSSWVFLAQRMTHQIKTPLSTILMSLERIQQIYQKKLPPEDAEKADAYVDGATTEIRRLIDSSRAFMQFLKIEAPAFECTDLSSFLDQFLQNYKMRLNPEITLETDFQSNLLVNLDSTLMNVVMENLLDNALKALREKGIIRLTAYGSEEVCPENRQVNGKAFLEIEDTGQGMSAELIRRVFEPYNSTRAEGTGLGLFIVRRIIEDHHAIIRITSREGLGTKVILEFAAASSGDCHG